MTNGRIEKLTKWARERITDLEGELRLAKALRWTEPVHPDLPPPEKSEELIKGFSVNPHWDSAGVLRSISSTVQRPIHQYSSEELAWRALRHLLELEAAKKLAWVDKEIEKCQKKQ